MSWMNDLYQTYEANADLAAENIGSEKAVLLPVSHSTQNAQIEITLDLEGNFLDAEQVSKDQAVTVIPVTEDSAARSSNACPHPLEDKLEYLAGDYKAYTGIDNEKKHSLYLEGLEEWCESPYSLPPVRAICSYITKGHILGDLIEKGIVACNADTGQLTNDKINGISQKDCFIRFTVDSGQAGTEDAVYQNKEVFRAYINYYEQKKNIRDLCYVSGKRVACSDKHGAKIRNAGDKAKLISANDNSGFTFRGRFSDSGQAVSVGYDVSQKAHSALRWLIQKQGFHIGELSIVAWEISGEDIPDIEKSSSESIFGDVHEEPEDFTNETYMRNLWRAVHGYQKKLDDNTQVVVMGVEAATTGRLSIRFYHKMSGSIFFKNICYWYETCFWRFLVKDKADENHWFWFAGSPALQSMAEAAFGNKNEKVIKSTMERLLPCIVEGRPIPKDIVRAAVHRASNPTSFESRAQYQHTVGVTCAMIRKMRYDITKLNEKKEEWTMELDRQETDRSYLFGRLLGAARKLEEVALFYAKESGRSTAAERYQQQFERRPPQTWQVIDRCLQPYKQKLKAMGKTYYENELMSIYSLFEKGDFGKKERLTELYLLGYSCQWNSYRNKEENDDQ